MRYSPNSSSHGSDLVTKALSECNDQPQSVKMIGPLAVEMASFHFRGNPAEKYICVSGEERRRVRGYMLPRGYVRIGYWI